jgi:hypothetical protein
MCGGRLVSEPEVERIGKGDAIRRQLRTAIRLFFERRDVVPIYTLAAASQELLRDLLRPLGKGSVTKDSHLVRPERKKEFLEVLNRPQNFFKHADRDPEEVLDFNSRSLEYVLFDCALMYQAYTGRHLREGFAFVIWFVSLYPDVLFPGDFKDTLERACDALSDRPSRELMLIALDRMDLWQEYVQNLD